MALALGLFKKLAPLLLNECKSVLAYNKEELNELKSNLHSEIRLFKKLASLLLLKEGKFVLAYKEELNELESNLHSAQAFLEDGLLRDADHHQNFPAPLKTSRMMRVIMEDIKCLVSDTVRFLESLDDDHHHHRRGRENIVVKYIKYRSVVLYHHYKGGRRLCRLNQRFKDIYRSGVLAQSAPGTN